MDTLTPLVRAYLRRRLTLDDFHAMVQEATWERTLEDDSFAAETLRILGEATSARWGQAELDASLEELLRLTGAGVAEEDGTKSIGDWVRSMMRTPTSSQRLEDRSEDPSLMMRSIGASTPSETRSS